MSDEHARREVEAELVRELASHAATIDRAEAAEQRLGAVTALRTLVEKMRAEARIERKFRDHATGEQIYEWADELEAEINRLTGSAQAAVATGAESTAALTNRPICRIHKTPKHAHYSCLVCAERGENIVTPLGDAALKEQP